MTNASDEPTLTDVMQSIAQLSQNVEQVSHRVDAVSDRVDKLSRDFDGLTTEFNELKTDVEKFNDRFSNYQQANQWVVQLAFTLIASATITIIVTSILRR